MLNLSYRSRLIAAFASLCGLMLVQSLVAYGLIHHAQLLEQRSIDAQARLVAYTNISADKQRLKVWYAEQLLTGKAPASVRDGLIDHINGNIQVLRIQTPAPAPSFLGGGALTRTDAEVLDVIEANFANFRSTPLALLDLSRSDIDKPQVWAEMLRTFDLSGGRDVRVLLANAIAQELRISQTATQEANAAIATSNTLRLVMIFITLSAALAMAWYFVRRLQQPLSDLMTGTARLQAAPAHSLLNIQVPQRSQDEFGSLAQSFNEMAREIMSRRASDLAKNETLEHAVATRTAELSTANEALRAEAQQRRHFFSDLSHELRTPATVILGEAEVGLRGASKTSDEYRQALQTIASTSRQLNQRIADLLLLSRDSLQSDTLALQNTPLAPLLEGVILQAKALALAGANGAAQDSDSDCESYADTDASQPVQVRAIAWADVLKNISIHTDTAKFSQLLMVFYDNALRYTPAGGVVQTQLSALDAGHITLSITDTGIGLSAPEQAAVFTRHFRGTQARLLRSDGAGLGLTIAKTLADSLGILVKIESKEIEGEEIEGEEIEDTAIESKEIESKSASVEHTPSSHLTRARGCTVTLIVPLAK